MKPSSTLHTSSSFEHLFFHTPDTYIHPTAVVGPDVILEFGVKIGPNAVILGSTHIGARTQIHANAMIGSTAQDTSIRAPRGRVVIGSDVVIKEFVTISCPKSDDGVTTIGDSAYLMHFSHVGHDAMIEHHVVLTNHAQVGGHAHIEHHVYLMANTGVHQRCRIGQYTALAPNSGARQDLPPYCLFTGQPGKFAGLNNFLLRREKFSSESIDAIKKLSTWFFREKLSVAQIVSNASEAGISEYAAVQDFLSFITHSDRGISRQRINE